MPPVSTLPRLPRRGPGPVPGRWRSRHTERLGIGHEGYTGAGIEKAGGILAGQVEAAIMVHALERTAGYRTCAEVPGESFDKAGLAGVGPSYETGEPCIHRLILVWPF